MAKKIKLKDEEPPPPPITHMKIVNFTWEDNVEHWLTFYLCKGIYVGKVWSEWLDPDTGQKIAPKFIKLEDGFHPESPGTALRQCPNCGKWFTTTLFCDDPACTESIGFTGDVGNDQLVTASAHGRAVGDAVYFTTTGSLPGGLNTGQLFYIITVVSPVRVEVSDTPGGSIVDITSTGTGTHTMSADEPTLPYDGYSRLAGEKIASGYFWENTMGMFIDFLTAELIPLPGVDGTTDEHLLVDALVET